MRALVFAILLGACAGDGDPVDDPEVPPATGEELRAWLDAGYYLGWSCEPMPGGPRPDGHGTNRVCSNAAIATTNDGAFPIDAASVKELYDGTTRVGFAVSRKLADGADGSGWWWYEAANGVVFVEGQGDAGMARDVCVRCHADAPRDFVYLRVP